MARVTGFTAERMQAIEDSCIVSGAIVFDNLHLTQRDGTVVDAGNVRGPQGLPAAITGASVVALAAGAAPTIDLGGSPDARTFQFGIPKGDKGDQGLKGDSSTPAGTIALWASDVAPANWLICDGAAVSRTTYASLFAAIGTKYGVGDGSTTFNVPNLKGRTPVGKDTTQTEFNALGNTGGEKAHFLSTAEMPSHTHIQDAHGHNLTVDTFASSGHGHGLSTAAAAISVNATSSNQITERRVSAPSYTPTHGLTPSATAAAAYTTATSTGAALLGATDSASSTSQTSVIGNTATNQSTGGGNAHNNLQPYGVVNFIIKISSGETASDSQLATRVGVLEAAGPLTFSVRDKVEKLRNVFSGGGIRKVSATDISWSKRFIAIGSGRDGKSTSGYFDISMPPDGTVIPVIGSTAKTSVTVAGGKIPVPSPWAALYYELPLGQGSASLNGNFHWVDYDLTINELPETWQLIIATNSDPDTPKYKWGDGRAQDYWKSMTLSNGWVAFGSGHALPAWKFTHDGKIKVKGLIKNGTVNASSASPAYAFPASYAPLETDIFVQPSNNDGLCRVDIVNTGGMVMYAFYGTGSNAWVSLAGIEWYPADLT